MGYTEDTVIYQNNVLVEVHPPAENWNINLFLLDFLETGGINEYSSWNLQEKFKPFGY